MSPGEEILTGLWRFTAIHPDWDGEESWDAEVAWWAVRGAEGLVLIDPLVEEWPELDGLVRSAGGCAGIVRTVFWHERSIPEAASRYGADVWARTPQPPVDSGPFTQAIDSGRTLPGRLEAFTTIRDDEAAVWLPDQRALVFGDVMLRDPDGRLSMCPEGWVAREGGQARLRQDLVPLLELEPEHVLVSHGPLVLGDGRAALERAVASAP